MPTRIDVLTPEQRSQMDAHADAWIDIGLRTGPNDKKTFEDNVRACYRFAGLSAPKVIVWVDSPLILAFTGPIAQYVLSALRIDKNTAVREAVSEAVSVAVHDAVHGAVGEAVHGAVREAVGEAVRNNWTNYIGGQFWIGGWWYGQAYASFFRDVCKLDLPGDLWDRAQAYEATAREACWWWPHRDFVIACTHPTSIQRELVDPNRLRGHGSHRLHCATGPAISFADDWNIWAWHGVRVTEQIILRPETITAEQIAKEPNAQVRQVMVERVGIERVCQMFNAQSIHAQGEYDLLSLDLGDGRRRPYLKMRNPSVGCYHIEGVHPDCRTVQQAINWRASGDINQEWKPEVLS